MLKERVAEIISTHNVDTTQNVLRSNESVGVPFDLRVEIVDGARNPSETLIALPEDNIVLLTERDGLVLSVPQLDINELIRELPFPEVEIAELVFDGNILPTQTINLFIPDGDDIRKDTFNFLKIFP